MRNRDNAHDGDIFPDEKKKKQKQREVNQQTKHKPR